MLHDLVERLLTVDFDGRVVLLRGHLRLSHRCEALALLTRQLARLLEVALVVRLLLSRRLKFKTRGTFTFSPFPVFLQLLDRSTSGFFIRWGNASFMLGTMCSPLKWGGARFVQKILPASHYSKLSL